MQTRERITVTIRKDVASKLRELAEEKDMAVSRLVNDTLLILLDPLAGMERRDGKPHAN
jgi:hypothetical protein